jgi:hypothetical protein
MARLVSLAHYAGSIAALVATLALIFGRSRPPSWARGLAWLALAAFALSAGGIAASLPAGTFDFSAFCESGREVLAGRDPIDLMQTSILPPLNPPTAFPLFAAFATGPIATTFAIWVAISALMALALVPLAWWALATDDASTRQIPISGILILAALVALSNATRACLGSGQLSIATAFAIVVALLAQSKGRGVLAGTWLAIATIKIGTMVPFLLLFRRRNDRAAWLAMIVVTAAICLTTGQARETPARVGRWLQGIARMSAPGTANDFTYAAPDNGDMIGLDHAFYRAGLKSRSSAKRAQFVVMGIIGAFVAWQVLGRSDISEGAKRSFVALFAMLFLYHRLSDAVILAIPLIHATGRARASVGRPRWLFAASALAILPILFMQRGLMKTLREIAERGGSIGRMIEIAVLPYACWCLIAALVLLALGEQFARIDRAGAAPVR